MQNLPLTLYPLSVVTKAWTISTVWRWRRSFLCMIFSWRCWMPISCTAHGSLTPALEWAPLPKKANVPRRPLLPLPSKERHWDRNLVRLKNSVTYAILCRYCDPLASCIGKRQLSSQNVCANHITSWINSTLIMSSTQFACSLYLCAEGWAIVLGGWTKTATQKERIKISQDETHQW